MKKSVIFMVLFTIIIFSSCDMLSKDEASYDYPIKQTQIVLDTVKEQNSEKLKTYMSAKSLNSVNSIDSQIEELFTLLGNNFEITDMKE